MRAVTWLHNLREQQRTSDWRQRNSSRLFDSNRRPRTTLAGAFVLLIGGLAAGGTQLIGAVAGNGNAPAPQSKAAANQSSQAGDNGASADASSGTPSPTHHSVSVSTNVDTNSDGQPVTQVTVNGQPVDVPSNGSTHQSINDGNQQTNVSVSQSTTGDASTHSTSHSQVHISTHSSSDIDQEDSVSSH